MTARVSGLYLSSSCFFRISAKNGKELYLANGEGYLPNFSLLHSLNQLFVLLEVFWFWFLLFSASKLLFWQRWKSRICVTIAEKIMSNKKI